MNFFSTRFSIIIYFLISSSSYSQTDSSIYDKDFIFTDGVYTSYEQLLSNSPKFRGCEIVRDDQRAGSIKWHSEFIRYHKSEKLFAFVQNGDLFIIRDGFYNQLIIKGAITYFLAEWIDAYSGQKITKMYLLNFRTGDIVGYNLRNFIGILKQDRELYDKYNALSNSDKAINLSRYIHLYNKRNPIYLPKVPSNHSSGEELVPDIFSP